MLSRNMVRLFGGNMVGTLLAGIVLKLPLITQYLFSFEQV